MATRTQLAAVVTAITEKLTKPGLLSFAGARIERQATRDLRGYFAVLGRAIAGLKLEELATSDQSEEIVRHAVEMKLDNVMRRHRPLLQQVLAVNLQTAYLHGAKTQDFSGANLVNKGRKSNDLPKLKEASNPQQAPIVPNPALLGATAQQIAKAEQAGKQAPGYPPVSDYEALDFLGDTAKAAADWAAQQSAALVTQIDATTKKQIADAISQGIKDRIGVNGTGRLVRDVLEGATRFRSEMIASTEMNRSMSQAFLDDMTARGREYKQIILSPDACDVCIDNAEDDPVPLDEQYPSGDLIPPFHPNCRCAITTARPPAGDDSEED